MKTLITGANGFIGSAVMRCLLEADHDIRVMVRLGSERRNLEGLSVEIIEGDLQDKTSLEQAVRGCNALFHLAADYRLWIPDPDNMYHINVTGTRDLMLASAEAGVEKIVYTSSVAVLGLNNDRTPANEETPMTIEDMIGHYKRSKYLAEKEVIKLVEENQLPAVIVNPSTPLGPRDIRPTPTGGIVVDTLNNRMPAYVDTGLNIAHVDDVAEGHLLAFEKGKIGERYILGGENLSLQAILGIICDLSDKNPPKIKLPHNLILPIAWCMERWADISKKEPRATVDEIRMSRKHMYFSSDKAVKELGYQIRPAHEAIKDAIEWFIKNGYCEPT
ncbi:MAG: NAD-dependent epimerase/dehydratase family protein [Gammaproteobacteria bacterium]|nr:NAD-dependent epimerase/dehydratase family protein [Gammaproteobacteria bacterium]